MSFTADFSRFTNYTREGGAKMVRFAGGAPALETEFNEIQLIANERIRELASLFGDGLLGEGIIAYVDGKLTIDNERAIVGGNLIYISHLELDLAVGEEAYLDVFEKELGYKDVMRKYGNEQEVAIENYIVDSRYMKEISRRIVLAYNLVKTTGEDGHSYLKLGYVSESGEPGEMGPTGQFTTEAPTAGSAEEIKEVENVVNRMSETLSQTSEAQRVLGETVKAQADEIATLRRTIETFSNIAAFNIEVPKDGWVKDEDMGDDKSIHVDIPIEGVNEGFVPLLTINPLSLVNAGECQMSSVTRTLDGYVRVYAKMLPTEIINASLVLFGVSNIIGGNPTGGGTATPYVLPVASKTQLGGIKQGEGIEIAPDGTASVTGAPVDPEQISQDGDAKEMLDEIFGNSK